MLPSNNGAARKADTRGQRGAEHVPENSLGLGVGPGHPVGASPGTTACVVSGARIGDVRATTGRWRPCRVLAGPHRARPGRRPADHRGAARLAVIPGRAIPARRRSRRPTRGPGLLDGQGRRMPRPRGESAGHAIRTPAQRSGCVSVHSMASCAPNEIPATKMGSSTMRARRYGGRWQLRRTHRVTLAESGFAGAQGLRWNMHGPANVGAPSREHRLCPPKRAATSADWCTS